MANYSKYINSTTVHYIANTGHDENGKYHGGQAGDQGGEYTLRPWYNRPWSVVLRYPDPMVGLKIAELACAAALNDHIGYDQYQRYTFWDELVKAGYDPSKITKNCETDCTASTTAIVKAVGHLCWIPALENIELETYSGNMLPRFVKAGFSALTAAKYLKEPDYLLPGDILLYEGHHAAINVTRGDKVESNPPAPQNPQLGDRVLKNGMKGTDVKELQEALMKLGYNLGKWGCDGDFGDQTEMAVRAFQTQQGLKVDGQVCEKTLAALKAALDAYNAPVDNPTYVNIVGGNCYVREEPHTGAEIIGVALEGSKYIYDGKTSEDGWLAISYKSRMGWVSGKYGRLVK